MIGSEIVPEKFDKNKYDEDYKKNNYDRMIFTVPKGGKDKLKTLAKGHNISVNALIISSIEQQHDIKLSKE